ncbi:MAG: response regulator [Kofleriaceae bacterium]|nr:response regulator [Kofleriaceae bacterium]
MNMSIRTRLILIIAGITLGCLLVGFTLVGFHQVSVLRAQRQQALQVLVDAVGDTSVSALAFGDSADGNESLRGLAHFADIEAAALYDEDGKLFATYSKRDGRSWDWPPSLVSDARPRPETGDDLTRVRQRVVHEGKTYGTIDVLASNDALRREIASFIETLAALAFALVVASIAAAWLLQRRITRSVLQLADIARRITRGEATSLRVTSAQPGELGVLAAGFNAMLENLAEREREVIASRDTLRAVIDASPVAIIACDDRGVVTLWNAQAAAVFGASEREAVGREIKIVAPDPALASVWSRCAMESLSALEIDVCGRALAFSTAPLTGGAIIMAVDMTERRRAAEVLVERAAQLQRAQKMDVVGRLAGGVAHDFNNLLTVVLASSQMMRSRTKGRADLVDYIDNVQAAAQRGAALSRRLLGFSRSQAIDERDVDLREVLGDLEKMMRSVIGEHMVVDFDLDSRPSVAHLDRGQLEQVLLNMVLNARDAMPGRGVLTIRSRVVDGGDAASPNKSLSGGWITIAVQDTGVGIAPEILDRVFEPFFTTKENGTGLGLATAQQIARDLRGEITVASELGVGTTFTLWLPMVACVARRPPADTVQPVRVGTDAILVIEDEPALRNVVVVVLAEAGYRVRVASTPTEAIELAAETGIPIDLLITDVVMPEMSGPKVAGEIARSRPDLPVLYMSGYVGNALSQHGLDERAPLLRKPFTPEQLLRMVRDTLDASHRERARGPCGLDG